MTGGIDDLTVRKWPDDVASQVEKWEHEKNASKRKLDLEERAVALQEREAARTMWKSPLALAILAAAIAAGGNSIVAFLGARQAALLEDRTAESALVLQMVKTGDADQAATNLCFLIDTGLLHSPDRVSQVLAYLRARTPGLGVSLQVPSLDGYVSYLTGKMAEAGTAHTKKRDDPPRSDSPSLGGLQEGGQFLAAPVIDRAGMSVENGRSLCWGKGAPSNGSDRSMP